MNIQFRYLFFGIIIQAAVMKVGGKVEQYVR